MRSRAIGRLGLVAACSVSAMSLACPALAQQADSQVSEVIVTAQKKSENVQDVPEQVTVLSTQFVDQFHATDLSDLGGYVPGLSVTTGGTPGQTTLSLRGIYPQATNATVGTYVDDIPVGGSSLYGNTNSFALDLLPYDMSDIEVLSGPQGTLYGASTLGGLLKYQLTQPSLSTFHEEVGGDLLGVQNAGSVGGGVRASINGPIIDGKLAFVASYAYENTPGYIDDTQTGEKGENEVSQQAARLGLVWAPDDRLRVELNGLYQQVSAAGLGEVALDPGTLKPLAGDLKDDNYLEQPFLKEIGLFGGRVTYDFGFADLTSITSYQYSNLRQGTDLTPVFGPLVTAVGGPDPTLSPEYQRIQMQKYTEEARLASKPNTTFEWLVGTFLTYEHTDLSQVVPLENADGSIITPFASPALGGATVSSPLAQLAIPSIYREYAAFGDFTWHVTPKFDLQGGVRYSYNSQDFGQMTTGSLEAPENAIGHSNASVVTYSVSPSYKITPDINAYVRIASGYQPGGPNVALPGVPPTVAADTITNYEIGLKTQFFDHRATLNVAAYYDDWDNIQVTALSAESISFLVNGGKAKSEGVEATGSVVPIRGLTLAGTFDYTDAVFTEAVPALGAVNGSPLPQTPRFSGSFQVNYTHPLVDDWSYQVGGGVRLESARYSAVNYTDLFFREDGYGALDLNASLQNSRYTVRLYVKNATDARGYTYAANNSALTGTPPQVSGFLMQPRTVGLAVDAKF